MNRGKSPSPTLILGTTSDDVAPPEQLAQLYNSLSGDEILATGFGIKADQQDISLRIVSGVFHAHNTYSREITTAFSQWLWDTYAIQIPEVSPGSTVRPLLWAGLYLFWGLAMVFLYRQLSHSALEVSYSLLSVKGGPFRPLYHPQIPVLAAGSPPCSGDLWGAVAAPSGAPPAFHRLSLLAGGQRRALLLPVPVW